MMTEGMDCENGRFAESDGASLCDECPEGLISAPGGASCVKEKKEGAEAVTFSYAGRNAAPASLLSTEVHGTSATTSASK